MLRFIGRRLLLMVPTLIAISMLSFLIIQLPPGDFLSFYVANLAQRGEEIDEAELEAIKARYGLDQPMPLQYLTWLWGFIRGDMGRSMQWGAPVESLIADRLPMSMAISLASLVFVYLVAIPIGTYSATHQYSIGDYIFTTVGFIGLAIPNFFLALVLLYYYYVATGDVVVGFFSTAYQDAPWSFARLWDMMKHMWLPTLVVGTAGTCGLIRVMRANLLDELQKPYVMVARSKGLSRRRVLYKYPFRMAINPMISTIGWMLPTLFGGELLVSLVLNIPTISPLFVGALLSQDMFLAGSIVMIVSSLTVIGTLISDIALGWVDPRIREAV